MLERFNINVDLAKSFTTVIFAEFVGLMKERMESRVSGKKMEIFSEMENNLITHYTNGYGKDNYNRWVALKNEKQNLITVEVEKKATAKAALQAALLISSECKKEEIISSTDVDVAGTSIDQVRVDRESAFPDLPISSAVVEVIKQETVETVFSNKKEYAGGRSGSISTFDVSSSSSFPSPNSNTGRNDALIDIIDDIVKGDDNNSVVIKPLSMLPQGGKHQRSNSGDLSFSGESSSTGDSSNSAETREKLLALTEEGANSKTELSALPYQDTMSLSPAVLSDVVVQESQPSQSQAQSQLRKRRLFDESSSESSNESSS